MRWMKNKDLRSSSSEGKVSSQCVVTNRNEEEETNSRMLEVNRDGMWMNRDKKFPWNGIKTTRYNILTFVPVNLFEQFRRLANFYFFIGVLLQLDESISPFPTWSVVTPFVFILSVTAIKEAYEDIKRWKEDRKLNQKMYKRVMKDGELRPVRSQNIRVGDILFVSKGEVFPADVILIGTSNHDNSCYINTAELDGETAPKSKRSADLGIEPTATSVSQIKAKIVASSPTAKFDGFEGRLEVDRSALASKDENSKGVVPLGDQQLCLRGSKVDNTEFVLCVVYATGKDTKLMLNRHANSFKFSSFEKKLNHGVFLQLLIQLIVNLLFASVNTLSKTFNEIDRPNSRNFLEEFATSFILFTYLIPLSLYVTMEFTRLGQGLIIEQDKDISIVEYELEENDDEIEEDSLDEDGNQKVSVDRKSEDLSVSHAVLPRKKIPKRKMAHVKTTDVNDELGQIEFICTDKTGTLTKNKMELKSLFVDGVEFINTKLFANLYEQELKKKERRERSGAVESMDSLVKAAFDSDKNEEARKSVHRNSTSKSKNGIFFLDFCLGLLVCNDIVVTRNDGIDASKGKYIYQSLSPDEIAFAEAMDSAGVTLCDSNDKMKVISLNGNGKRSKEKYIIHGMLGFSADRKRMSVVVEDSLGVKKLLCKGADSMLKTFLNGNDELTNQHVKQTDDALSRFASDGNRTLMLVSRTLCESEFNSWKDAFTDASVSVSNRELKIEKSFALIENNMRLLGCTSVEDPLQDGVPESIDALLAANIVVVVLTGDKQETAVAIGKQSRIIQPDAELFFISSEEVASLEFELSKILKSKASHRGHIAIIISGNALEVAIREKRDLFLSALAISQTVVCSRTTPHQKAGMVLLVKRHLKKIVLAIGDGANDVSMLQKANVGVGLTGKEGTQAAQTADFVLHRFRHLPRLLFIHGRFSYIRMSKVVLWSFYKNTLFPLPLLLFGFFSVFSDMRLYDSLLMTSFNMFFTSLPPFAIGWTEKDAPESFILSNPSLYHKFRILDQFNLHRFVRWLSLGVVQGLIIYWFAFGVFFDTDVISSDGKVSGLWVFGHWIYTAITFVITGTFLLTAANWTRLLLVSCFLGPAVYLLGWSVVGYSFDFSPEIYGLPPYLLGVAKSYFFQILVFALCVVPIFLHNLKQRYIKRTYIYELMDAQSS